MSRNLVMAITGASGAIYAVRLLEVLLGAGCDVYLSISAAARTVLKDELDLAVDLDDFNPSALLLDAGAGPTPNRPQQPGTAAGVGGRVEGEVSLPEGRPGEIRYFHYLDHAAPVASGSFPTDGMVVCPCSGGTLSAIAHAAAANLIQRAAEVHLKERRKLILVPRETPLSLVQLDNMKRAAEAGAVILPAMPGFYHGVESVRDLVDFVVARICDQLAVQHALIRRWGS